MRVGNNEGSVQLIHSLIEIWTELRSGLIGQYHFQNRFARLFVIFQQRIDHP
jgi:hypothetical protein